jgi:hypothetical protein
MYNLTKVLDECSADILPFRRNVDDDAMLNCGPLVVSRSGDEHDLRRSFRCSFRTWLKTQVHLTVSTSGLFHIRHNQNSLTTSIEDSVCDIVIGLFSVELWILFCTSV